MADFGLDDTGLTVPRAADILADIQANYRERTGLTDIDFSDDALLQEFAGVVADRLDSLGQALVAVYDSFDPLAATGTQAENLARIVGVNRNPATPSRVSVALAGTTGTAVGAGLVLQGGGDDGTSQWVTIDDGTIPTTVTAEALEGGPTALSPGVMQIVTPIEGLTSATATAEATLGTAQETIEQLRVRRPLSIAKPGAHTVPALYAALLDLSGVSDVLVIDNPDTEARVVQGITLAKHSYRVFVLPNPLDTAARQAVVDTIAEHVHFGVKTDATDFTQIVTDSATGAQITVGFDYGRQTTLTATATFTLAPTYAVSDIVAELQDLVDVHVATLGMGDALRHLHLATLADQVDGVLGASFSLTGSGSADYEADADEAVVAVVVVAA